MDSGKYFSGTVVGLLIGVQAVLLYQQSQIFFSFFKGAVPNKESIHNKPPASYTQSIKTSTLKLAKLWGLLPLLPIVEITNVEAMTPLSSALNGKIIISWNEKQQTILPEQRVPTAKLWNQKQIVCKL